MSFTSSHLYFDDVSVGQEWQSLARTITETDIVSFAGLSGDFNPIHMDREFAKTTLFRQPIAHGLLIFAISSGLSLYAPPMRTLAFMNIRDWQFKGPIFIGDTIHVRSKIMEKQVRSRGRRGVITWLRQIFNQQGKMVQEGTTLTLVEGRAAKGAGEEAAASTSGRTESGS
jgi:3-hydroxybutyryl-CoA dehydratase